MDGILVVDKPKGWTSHDVVDFIRKKFELKKVGHAGTLDPMATGVLVMLIGRYTKSSGVLISDDKRYEGVLMLGAESDTGDADGKVTSTGKPTVFTEEKIREVFNKFLGSIEQTPPMYSAVKIKGRKLYELARKGIKADPEPRKVTIKNIDIINIRLPEITFDVTCSKGTYIRQLAVDIGKVLECGAYLSALKRTSSGKFDIKNALNINEVEELSPSELEERLVRP